MQENYKKQLRQRRDHLKKEIFELGRSDDYTPEVRERKIQEMEATVKHLREWIAEPMKYDAEQANEAVAKIAAQAKEQPMTKAEFDAEVEKILGDGGEEKRLIRVPDNKTLDRIWPWIKTADISVQAPKSVLSYWKVKLKNERVRQL